MLDGNADILEIVQTDYGAACITYFGVGLAFGGKFTAATIMTVCAKAFRLVDEDKRKGDVYWFPDFNKYAWIPWSRMTERYANAIRHRMHLSTRSNVTLADADMYLGMGPYRDFWSSYISTSDRIATLTTAFRDVRGLRLLELGCGTGNQLLPLAAYDIEVYGMELNPRFVAERHPLLWDRVTFGDAIIDPWLCYAKSSFDAIVVSMLGFVDFCDAQDFFTGLAHLLPAGGALIIDTFKSASSRNIQSASTYRNALTGAGFTPVILMNAPHQQLICKKDA